MNDIDYSVSSSDSTLLSPVGGNISTPSIDVEIPSADREPLAASEEPRLLISGPLETEPPTASPKPMRVGSSSWSALSRANRAAWRSCISFFLKESVSIFADSLGLRNWMIKSMTRSLLWCRPFAEASCANRSG